MTDLDTNDYSPEAESQAYDELMRYCYGRSPEANSKTFDGESVAPASEIVVQRIFVPSIKMGEWNSQRNPNQPSSLWQELALVPGLLTHFCTEDWKAMVAPAAKYRDFSRFQSLDSRCQAPKDRMENWMALNPSYFRSPFVIIIESEQWEVISTLGQLFGDQHVVTFNRLRHFTHGSFRKEPAKFVQELIEFNRTN